MKETDILYIDYTKTPHSDRADNNRFSHFGWEGIGGFALWKFADSYFQGAECLFEKFKNSPGQYAVLDGLGLPICFMYRHYVELTLKELNLRFVCKTEDEYKELINKGHNIFELWKAVKPTLKRLRDRVGSSVSLGVLESYIKQIHQFDQESTTARYPLDQKLKATNPDRRLDIFNLHDRMFELHDAFEALAHDLENQITATVEVQKLKHFVIHYAANRKRVEGFLKKIKLHSDDEIKRVSHEATDFFSTEKKLPEGSKPYETIMDLLKSQSDDMLILLDALYYVGREIICEEIRLPKNHHEAAIDAVKKCVINMNRDGLEFGQPANSEINIYGKQASALFSNIRKSLDIIDDLWLIKKPWYIKLMGVNSCNL